MKKILLIMCLILCFNKANSQVKFDVDTVFISHIIDSLPHGEVNEWYEKGPSLSISASIINSTESTISINPDSVYVYIEYNYKFKSYQLPVGNPWLVYNRHKHDNEIKLRSLDTLKLEMNSDLFDVNDKNIFPFIKHDYTNDVIETLPTIRLYFYYPGRNKIYSGPIKNVVISKYN
jgi:hypothetical protein